MAVIELAKDKGWGAHIRITVADTPAADAAAAEFLRRVTKYEVGENYHVADVVEEETEGLGLCLEALLFPLCEHGMSAQLCAGPQHYPYDDEERAHYGY